MFEKDELKTKEDLKRKELFERISKYREKEKFYNEEKTRLNNLSQTLNEELKLSQKKDEEDYLASLEKEKISEEKITEVETEKEERVVNVEKIPEKDRPLSDTNEIIEKTEETPKEKISENNKPLHDIDETPTPKEIEVPIENVGNVNQVIEEIPNEEKKIIEKAMEEDIPMEFESPKVKTDYKAFIKNNIVKLVSGFKISSKIKNIIERNTKRMLMTTAVLTLWTSGNSFVKPSDVEGDVFSIKKKEVLDTVNKTLEISDIETYNKLSENGKRIYLYASSKIEESYVIVDKPSATLFIIGADKKLIGQMPVLLGQTKGETPNMSDAESDTAVQATTPSGKYTLLRLAGEEDLITYKGKVFSLCGSDALALHITYPPEKEKRTEALNTPTPEDNRMSWGCINISEEMWGKYIEGNIEARGAYMFITPDNPIMSLNPETGQVEKGNYNFLAMN
jgi:5'-deoxynucleotidase YfbR-like HD superfamily hydrolase